MSAVLGTTLPSRYSVLCVLRRSPRPRRHENTILLDKLSKILTREKGAQGGGAKLPKVAAPPIAGGGLHDAYRKKVREQIDRENQSLLRRLQYMKPSIDMVHFEQQWRENAQFARSQVIGNPMLEPRVAPRLSSRPQTVPSGGGRPGRRRPSSAARGGARQETPAHYLQPLYSERDGAGLAAGHPAPGQPPVDAFPPAGDQAVDQALYAELGGASEADSAQSAPGDADLAGGDLGGSSLGDGDAAALGSASAAN